MARSNNTRKNRFAEDDNWSGWKGKHRDEPSGGYSKKKTRRERKLTHEEICRRLHNGKETDD